MIMMKEGGAGIGGEILQFNFDEVFQVLKHMKYDHCDGKVFDACFKNWDVASLDDEEVLLAALIRLAIFVIVSDMVKRFGSGDFDMRDVLILLISKGLGLNKLSQVIEVAEKGLESFYEEKHFNVLYGVVDKMFEMLADKLADEQKVEGVVLQ